MARDVHIAVFTRAPVRGEVKTRLAAAVGNDEALATHVELLESTLAACAGVRAASVELWVAGDPGVAELTSLAQRFGVALQQQRGRDLGQRMLHAVSHHTSRGRACIVVGSDIAALETRHVQDAVQALDEGADVVLGPAEDGGYWLIGLNHAHATLFEDIPWSTDRVLARTLQRAAAGLKVVEVATLWDVDDEDDWRRWRAVRPASPPSTTCG